MKQGVAINKRRFTIGDWACSDFACEVEYMPFDIPNPGVEPDLRMAYSKTGFKRQVIREPKKVYGQVVGFCYKTLGTYEPQSGGGYFAEDGDVEQAYLSVESTQFFWQVKEGMLNKPKLILDEDIKPGVIPASPSSFKLPLMKSNQPAWDERAREFARKEAKDKPRKNGKFAKI